MNTQMDAFVVRAERLIAASCTMPFIDRVERKEGEVLLGEWYDYKEYARIYYRPMTMNKAVIPGLFLAVTRNDKIFLCQDLRLPSNQRHPHGSGILCSEGHSPLGSLLRRDKPLELLMMGLSYFGALNPSSLAHPTPGIFNCSDCGEIIMGDVKYAKANGKVYLYHRRHIKRCSTCHRVWWPFQDYNPIKRRTWPQTGGRIRRLTCENCIKNMKEATTCSCAVCHEQLYRGIFRGRKRCCHHAYELMHMTMNRWPLYDVNSYVNRYILRSQDDIF
jgi:hypothetical protein